MKQVVLIPGDGIGPEVIRACLQVMEAASCSFDWVECEAGEQCIDQYGDQLPGETVDAIRQCGVAIKGPVTTPVGSGFKSVNVRLRQELDLYACVRPARALPGVKCLCPELDVVIVRENTEGLYAGIEREVDGGYEAVRLVTQAACDRIVQFAFDYACEYGRNRVTAVHKGNILKKTDGLFLDRFNRIARAGCVDSDDLIVDNAAMQMALAPQRFDVVVTTNLFGDILSDLAAGLTGGPGLAAGGNIGSGVAVFEPVHGSGPDIAGKGIANPTATILSAVMMLEYLGYMDEADKIGSAVDRVLERGEVLTPDLGGRASCAEFAGAVCADITS